MISIVIPVFNTRPTFFAECICSVLVQTCQDFEVILVDDGSEKNTAEVCDEIAKSDRRFRVIHQPNRGLSAARNAGIAAASGEYITFLDSDDQLHPYALELWLYLIENENVDAVITGFVDKPEQLDSVKIRPHWSTTIPAERVLRFALYQKIINSSACGKLFRRRLFDDIRFAEGLYYEDLEIFPRLMLKCRQVTYNFARPYCYRQHPDSFIHRWSPRRLDVLKVTEMVEESLADASEDLRRAARDRRLSANFNMFALASLNGQPAVADACWQLIRRYRRDSLLNPKVRLKNKLGILLSYLGPTPFRTLSRFLYK